MSSSACEALNRAVDRDDEFFHKYKANFEICVGEFSAMMRRHGHTYEPLIAAATDRFAAILPGMIASNSYIGFALATTTILAICLSAIGASDEHAAVVTRALLSVKPSQ